MTPRQIPDHYLTDTTDTPPARLYVHVDQLGRPTDLLSQLRHNAITARQNRPRPNPRARPPTLEYVEGPRRIFTRPPAPEPQPVAPQPASTATDRIPAAEAFTHLLAHLARQTPGPTIRDLATATGLAHTDIQRGLTYGMNHRLILINGTHTRPFGIPWGPDTRATLAQIQPPTPDPAPNKPPRKPVTWCTWGIDHLDHTHELRPTSAKNPPPSRACKTCMSITRSRQRAQTNRRT